MINNVSSAVPGRPYLLALSNNPRCVCCDPSLVASDVVSTSRTITDLVAIEVSASLSSLATIYLQRQ